MKKQTKKLIFICLLLCAAMAINVQAQTTCATAVTYTYPVTQTVTSYSNATYWFTLTTPGAGNYQLKILNGSGKISTASVYTGSCSSLSLFTEVTDSINYDSATVSNLVIPLTNTASTTYYIALNNKPISSATFSITTIRQLLIAGELAYDTGYAITLFALPIGPSGTPSYTWMPGGYHTDSITITPTANTTYTLNYVDAFGGLTFTATINPHFPPIHNCQLVPNGDFEGYQYNHNDINNIAWAPACTSCSTCYPGPLPTFIGISDPKTWQNPTCATPDYFNSHYGGTACNTQPNGVPYNEINALSCSSISPHGGDGYAGLMTYYYHPHNDSYANISWFEYLQSPLSCALTTGQLYNVSFWASLSGDYDAPSNNIGAYLSSSAPSLVGNGALNYSPQVNSNAIINNVGSWKQVSGTMVGGGEQYITVGNFYNVDQTLPYPSEGTSYFYIDDINVTPVQPTITVSSCQSGSITLTAYGAASVNTSWFDGTTHYSGNPLIIPSPSSATTFTCTVTLSSCLSCPTLTTSITIQPETPCMGTAPTYTPTSNVTLSTASSPYYSVNNIQINSGINYTMNDVELRMAPGTTITVASGGTLTVEGSWLHVCDPCSGNMWQGIIVNNGGKLVFKGAHGGGINFIEDAKQAVYTSSGSTAPSYTINTTIFNNNTEDIVIDANTADLSANQIYGCIFTCRNIGSHSNLATNFASIKADITASTPIHPSTTNPTDLTIAGARTTHGIYVNTQNITYPIKVGGNNSSFTNNIFDNLDIGIYAVKSNLTVINNNFQNLTGNQPDIKGIGIYSDANTGTLTGVKSILIVGNSTPTIVSGETNNFRDCMAGVSTKNMREVYINNNTFNNETTAPNYTTTATYITGGYGVVQQKFAASASASDFENLQFCNNTVQNCANGHLLNFQKIYNTASNSLYIASNTITASEPNYCTYGLGFGQGHAGGNTGVQQDAVNVTANTINNADVAAIYANNINFPSGKNPPIMQIYNNTELSIKYNSAATTTTSPRTAAVSLSGCYSTRVTYNQNIGVTGFNGTYNIPSAQYQGGVYAYQSPYSIINCNSVIGAGEGFIFDGTCTLYDQYSWQNNTMAYNQYGLVLRSSGIIGDQGSATYPINDIWYNNLGTPHPVSFIDQTLADGSDPSSGSPTSKLYTQVATCSSSGTTYQPCLNTYVFPGTAYSNPTTLINITSGTNTLNCGMVSGDRVTGNHNQVLDNNAASDSLYNQNIVNSLTDTSYHYPMYDAQTRWGLQYLASCSHPGINAANGYEHAKTLALAGRALATDDYGSALSLTNSFGASNTIESNWQSVNNMMVKMASDTLNSSDIGNLQSVASQCPHTGGSIVWTARALIDGYYGYIHSYPNDCPANNSNNNRIQATTGISQQINSNQLKLYPNPNNGSMSIEYSLQKDTYLEITDINGSLVGKYNLPATNTKLDIRNDNLNNGVYLYRVLGEKITTGKFVIMK